jgi:hypothetical protein
VVARSRGRICRAIHDTGHPVGVLADRHRDVAVVEGAVGADLDAVALERADLDATLGEVPLETIVSPATVLSCGCTV